MYIYIYIYIFVFFCVWYIYIYIYIICVYIYIYIYYCWADRIALPAFHLNILHAFVKRTNVTLTKIITTRSALVVTDFFAWCLKVIFVRDPNRTFGMWPSNTDLFLFTVKIWFSNVWTSWLTMLTKLRNASMYDWFDTLFNQIDQTQSGKSRKQASRQKPILKHIQAQTQTSF